MSVNINKTSLKNELGLGESFAPFLAKVDLEGVFKANSLTPGTDIYYFASNNAGMCYDPTNYNFYVILNDGTPANRKCIVLKLNANGEIVTSKYFTDRCYLVCVVANGGKLYAIENRGTEGASAVDELNMTNLSIVENIVNLATDDYRYGQAVSKVSDTVLCLVGRMYGGGDPGIYIKIDLPGKSYTRYTPGTGAVWNCLKYGSYVYADRYQQSQGNFKIDLTDWSYSATGTPPITTYDCQPIIRYGDKILHGGGGAGAEPPAAQPAYWYDVTEGTWTELTTYSTNDKCPSLWGAIYFPKLKKAIFARGSTRYGNAPASQWLFNLETEKWTNITHLFDGLYAEPDTLDYNWSTTGTSTIKRLSGGGSMSPMTGGGECDDTENFGMHPCGFWYEGMYRFLMMFDYRYYDEAEKTKPVLVFGTFKL